MAPSRRAGVVTCMLVGMLAACSRDTPPAKVVTLPTIATLTVTIAADGDGRAWDGVVEAVREARLSAQTSGRVVTVARDVNDAVTTGDVLVRLSDIEQRADVDDARARLRVAEATLIEVQATHRRHLELAGKQFVSEAQLDQVRTALDSARAARDAARARIAQAAQQADYTTVRAPYAGLVSARSVEPGESITPGQWLMTVFATDTLRIEVSVPQSEAAKIRVRPVARIAFDDGRRVDAARVSVFPNADASTHSVNVRVELPRLSPVPMPGTTAKVAFPVLGTTAYPRVPVAALMRRGEVDAVYVLAGERLSLRQLRLGEQIGDAVDVISGLAPGEKVAADPIAAAQALAQARRDAG